MKTPRVVVLGSCNTDMVIRLAHLPRPGETVSGGQFATAAGGKGANQAVAASRAGGAVKLIARVGKDVFGDRAVEQFIRDGIDTTHVVRDPESASGVALIFVGGQGENCIGVAGGANEMLSPTDIAQAAAAITGADVLVMQLETPPETIAAAAELAARHGVPVILNPAPSRPLPDELLARVSILTPNETEAEQLTGIAVCDESTAAAAAAALRSRGPATVIITLGAHGALIADASGTRMVPGFAVEAVDTTAAGDVFSGVLAVAMAEGRDLTEAVHWASAAAAISVTRFGAQPSMPTRPEIVRFFNLLAEASGTR